MENKLKKRKRDRKNYDSRKIQFLKDKRCETCKKKNNLNAIEFFPAGQYPNKKKVTSFFNLSLKHKKYEERLKNIHVFCPIHEQIARIEQKNDIHYFRARKKLNIE